MALQQQWCALEALKASCSKSDQRLLDRLQPLLTVESLTQGLEKLDPNFSVELMSLAKTDDYYSEHLEKPIKLCRKVLLQLSDTPVIYAESHCLEEATIWAEYLHCGTSSLGRRLFSPQEKLQRSPFSYALFTAKDLPIFSSLENMKKDVLICARRSFFINNEQLLFITEWYLPALLEKIDRFNTKL